MGVYCPGCHELRIDEEDFCEKCDLFWDGCNCNKDPEIKERTEGK